MSANQQPTPPTPPPYDTTPVDNFKAMARQIDPQSFLGGCIQALTEIGSSTLDEGRRPMSNLCYSTPYHCYLYCSRHLLAKYVINTTSDPEYNPDELLDQMIEELDTGIFFAVANWLDYKDEHRLHDRWRLPSNMPDTRPSKGLVLRAYYPVMAAAAALSVHYFPYAAAMVPLERRRHFDSLAIATTMHLYKDQEPADDNSPRYTESGVWEDIQHGRRRLESLCLDGGDGGGGLRHHYWGATPAERALMEQPRPDLGIPALDIAK